MRATGALEGAEREAYGRRSGASELLEREAELGRLEGLLRLASRGHGRLLCVEGEAGIGKTALLEALVERARSAGATVLRAPRRGARARFPAWRGAPAVRADRSNRAGSPSRIA